MTRDSWEISVIHNAQTWTLRYTTKIKDFESWHRLTMYHLGCILLFQSHGSILQVILSWVITFQRWRWRWCELKGWVTSSSTFLLRSAAASEERLRERSLWVRIVVALFHYSLSLQILLCQMQDKLPSLCSDGFPPIQICRTPTSHSAAREGLGNINIANKLHKGMSERYPKVRSSAGWSCQ